MASYELEDELELEDESEQEGILGAIGSALSGLLGEGEEEWEAHEHEFEDESSLHELEGLHEDELEFEDESSLHELEGLHEDEFEFEGLHEDEFEFEGLHEDEGEMFFKGIGRFLRRAAPMLKQIARVAVPLVSTAVGGPLGGVLGKVATSALGEGEEELELEGLHEDELELEGSHEYEAALYAPLTEHQALAELMAGVAAEAHTESEAEAMIGAATVSSLSARERRELHRVLGHLVRGSAILTRLLRRRRLTRPAVRTVPMIVHSTADTLVRRAAAGQPINRHVAAQVMARHTGRVLSNPRVCGLAIRRNVVAGRRIQRRAGIPTVTRPMATVSRPIGGVPRRRSNGGAVRRPIGRVTYSARPRRGRY